MEFAQFAGVAAATVLLILIPGPSVVFIVGQALARGRETALLSAAGNAAGALLAGAVIAVGLGFIIEQSAIVVEAMRLVGAATLVALGIAALVGARKPLTGDEPPGAPSSRRRASFLGAVVVGVTNPKVYVIFGALLPAFVHPTGSVPPVVQMLLLVLVPVTVGLALDSAWALAASVARRALITVPSRVTTVKRVGGLSLIAVGAYTAVHRS
jgi:threonine/homoserine/homoserine lactone efflux protein